MKTVHWPGRCPPLTSLNLNRLLGHASKRTPIWDTFSDAPESCQETVVASNLGWPSGGPLIRGASARSMQGRFCETAAEAAQGWTASGTAMLAFERLRNMCGCGSWNVDDSNMSVREMAPPPG
jgi:hypothetical protein